MKGYEIWGNDILYFHDILGGNVSINIEEIWTLVMNQLKRVNLVFAIQM